MALPRTQSVAVGLALLGITWGIYGQVVPKVADIRQVNADNPDIVSAERAARYSSASLVLLVTVMTRDATVFVLGGVGVVTFSWLHRHANMVDPNLGRATVPSSRVVTHAGDGTPAGFSPSA